MRRSRRSARSAGASCCGSASPTCACRSAWPRSGYALTDLASATLEAALAAAIRSVERSTRRADADPDGDRRDGSLRRLRARLRQRRRRDVRARPAARRRPAAGRRRWPRRWPTTYAGCCSDPGHATRRWRSTPTCDPRAGRARWCAPWTPTPPTTASGRRSGRRRRCCAPRRSSGTPSCATRFRELIDPLRFPEDGPDRRRRGGGTPDQGARGRRAAAPRRRPGHPLQARPRRPLRRRVDGPAAAAASTPRRIRSCARRRPSRRSQVAVEHDLLDLGDADALAEAWRFASRARNATVQVRGKPSDQLPRDARERAAVAAILQYEPGRVRRDGQRLPAHRPPGAGDRGPGVLVLKIMTSVSGK